MIYKANITQSVDAYWDMWVTVEANNQQEAEEKILNKDFEKCESQVEPAGAQSYDLIHAFKYREILEKIDKGIKLGVINFALELCKEIHETLYELSKNDIEIHIWENLDEDSVIEFTEYNQLSYKDNQNGTVALYLDNNKLGQMQIWFDVEQSDRKYLTINHEIVYLDALKQNVWN